MAVFSLTPNRVTSAIEKTRALLETVPADKVESVDTTLALDFGEHFAYQEAQARAHAAGLLSMEEAMIIYAALGEVGSESNGGWAAGVDTATKYAVTRVVGLILEQRLAAPDAS